MQFENLSESNVVSLTQLEQTEIDGGVWGPLVIATVAAYAAVCDEAYKAGHWLGTYIKDSQ